MRADCPDCYKTNTVVDPNAAPGMTIAIGGGAAGTAGLIAGAGSTGGAIDSDGKVVAYADAGGSLGAAKIGESGTAGVAITVMNGKTGDMAGGFETKSFAAGPINVTQFSGKGADKKSNISGVQVLIGPGEGVSAGAGKSYTVTTKPRTIGEAVTAVGQSIGNGFRDATKPSSVPRIPTNCRGGSSGRAECHS